MKNKFGLSELTINLLIEYFKTKPEIEKVKIIATVISDKNEGKYKDIYTIKVDSVNDSKKYYGTKLILYVPKSIVLEYGNYVIIDGIYQKANVAKNYGAFDYREYLKVKNVYGTISANDIDVIKQKDLNFIFIYINDIRMTIKENIMKIMGEEGNIAIRYFISEIFLIYKIILFKNSKIATFIIF